MSDWFYSFTWCACYPAFWISSSPTVLNAQVTRRDGAYILAANHHSPYDIPLLMRHAARRLDFVSIVEVFKNPLVAAFYGSMNAFPLDRGRPDAKTVRVILQRLERGRVVAMFPEGQFREESNSVINGGPIRRGIGTIAQLANVPVIPCVVMHSSEYSNWKSWLPLKRTAYAINFGQPLHVDSSRPPHEAASRLEDELCAQFRSLYQGLLDAEKPTAK